MKTTAALILFALLFTCRQAAGNAADVDELVETVRAEALLEASHDEQRVNAFLDSRDRQAALLREAEQALAEKNREADRLRAEYEQNEQELTESANALRENAGDLQDTFAIVRQSALSADNVLGTSLVAAEQVDRSSFLQDLGKSQQPPSIEDIRTLWTSVIKEIAESGKVVQFDATVIQPEGNEVTQTVTRVGVFNSVADGAFLRYLPDAGKLVKLSRQPAARYQNLARTLETASEEFVPMALDPSKGAILSLMVQSPTVQERIRQGGIIGYIILALGVIGVLFVVRRSIALLLSRRAIDSESRSKEPTATNALGRLRLVASETAGADMETMGVRMDEQLAEEASLLNRGLPTVAVLAAVSPLLGLLGTVTGMIETFQSITLFGTGDPKLMSGGISQALITTQLGLAVAIPLVLFHSLLSGRVNRLVERLGKHASELVTERELDNV